MDVEYLPPIIGITGKAGAGKDTLAKHLVSGWGYVRYSLADPIKDMLNARFGWDPANWEDRYWKENDLYGGFSPRSWAQWLGTEVGRTLAGQDVWINALLVKAAWNGHAKRCVIPDVRFDNEAEAIINNGGIVIRVLRDVPGVAQHVSEAGVNDLWVDYTIYNDGNPYDMAGPLDKILRRWSRNVGRDRA